MGLYKRGGVWWMRLTVGGRKEIRRTTGTGDRRLAEKIERKVRTEIAEGRWFDVQEERTRTVREMLERFEQEYASHRKATRFYGPIIARFIAEWGDRTLAEVTPAIISQWKTRRLGEVSAASVNRALAVLRCAFNVTMREWEWCRDNPVVRVKREKEPPGRDRWLSAEEEGRVLQAAPPWFREVITFAVNTGMRQGEILSLRWSSVDLFRRTVTVERSKNGEKRTVPINEAVLTILKEKSRVRSLKADLVFHSEAHTAIDPANLRHVFGKALEKAKIEDFRFHDLRHTFATRLVQAGVDMYKVQRLLGHKTPTMTQRYAHHSTESLRDGVEVLDRVRLLLATAQNPAQSVPVKVSGAV
ncbi:MAG: site-specific integrase [Nitrospirae bacterium]|nr:site-specific integrase [Nitrospirota bacterium]